MNPVTPILVTLALLLPALYLVIYCHQHIRMARRPEAARLQVLQWVWWFAVGVACAYGIFQIVWLATRPHHQLVTYGPLVWPCLLLTLGGFRLQIHRQKKRMKELSARRNWRDGVEPSAD